MSAPILLVIHTGNAIELLNTVIRKATRQRKAFPTDESAMRQLHSIILRL